MPEDNALGIGCVGLVTKRLVKLRIEGLTNCIDRLETAGDQEVTELAVHHCEAVDNSLRRCIATRRIETKFEIVQNWQQLLEKAGICKSDRLLLLPDHALAVVLKIGRCT